MGRGQGIEGNLLYGEAPQRRGASLQGLTGKPALLPRLPGAEGVVTLDRALTGDLVRAFGDMGPDDRKTRAVGVFRYLLHLLEPGFEKVPLSFQNLEGELQKRLDGPDVEVSLTDAEWRSVYRSLEHAHARGMGLSAPAAERAMATLFGVGPGEIDLEVECASCGRDASAHDSRIADGRWVGEVCCLGRRTMVPAEAFPEDAVNF